MVEQIATGITREQLVDDHISIYTVNTIDYTLLTVWNQAVINELRHIPDDQRIHRLLYDLSAGGVCLPYLMFNNYQLDSPAVIPAAKDQIQSIIHSKPELTIRLAFVTSVTISGKMVKSDALMIHEDRIHTQIFFKRNRAMDWLQEK